MAEHLPCVQKVPGSFRYLQVGLGMSAVRNPGGPILGSVDNPELDVPVVSFVPCQLPVLSVA